jgi:hypothetical protein
MDFFKTEPVTVITREYTKNELGEVTETKEMQTQADVLVCPKSTQNLGSERPDGDKIVYNLHFKKGWSTPLRGALIEVRGERYRVDGDPQPLTVDNCPTPFNLAVSVVRCDG